jgi:pimeloyl-ACP methyl ester carboxylesterase
VTARGTGTPRLAGLVTVILALVTAGCGGGEPPGRAGPARAPSSTTSAPATTEAVDKPCLRGVGGTRVVRFRSDAGAELVGVVLGRGRTGVVLAHGRGSDLCEWVGHGRRFAGWGYQVLAFDFGGFGDSRAGTGPGAGIVADLRAAAGQLRRGGASRVVLVGSSMGATAALAAAPRIRPPVAGVVSLSGPAAFGAVDAWSALPRLGVPVLFVAAAGDEPFVSAARAMHRRARAADKRLLVVGRGHGSRLLAFREDGPRALAALRRFLADRARG